MSDIKKIISKLQKMYPGAECSLTHESPFELLIATVLSAQCTDARVNIVTPALFKKYPTPEAMAKADKSDIERLISSTGFFRQKTKSLLGTSQKIVAEHGGEVPQTVEELTALPGVGRKTANVVLGNAFGKPAGIVVDTHVKRLSFRLGLTKQTDPEKIEKELNQIVPKQHWVNFPHWLIQHGRAVCMARNPQCESCELLSICPRKGLSKIKSVKGVQKTLVKRSVSHYELSR